MCGEVELTTLNKVLLERQSKHCDGLFTFSILFVKC